MKTILKQMGKSLTKAAAEIGIAKTTLLDIVNHGKPDEPTDCLPMATLTKGKR